jgi:AraC family transcriptional regulator, transcriptional activator of pobA
MTLREVRFDRRKYGRHLLIDVARVRGLDGFIIDAPHALAFFDVTLVTDGAGHLSLDGERLAVQPGTVLFTVPGQARRWEVTGLDGICLFFEDFFVREFLHDDAFLDRLPFFHADPSRAFVRLSSSSASRLKTRLTAMRRELGHYRRDSLDLLRAQLHETLIVLAREFAAAHGVAPQRPAHPIVSRYVELVARDAAKRHDVSDYAAELSVSPGHLSVLCQRYVGRRAKRVLDEALVTRARRMLLYGNDTVARIGTSLGFSDPSYFSRFFRRETGQTPERAPGFALAGAVPVGCWSDAMQTWHGGDTFYETLRRVVKRFMPGYE